MGCFGGRCRRKGGAVVECGATTCAPDQQCCSDVIEGDRCLAADDTCPGETALCDDPTDCAPKERCCSGPVPLTVCALRCELDIACLKDTDCPGDKMHCCPQTLVPWKICRSISC